LNAPLKSITTLARFDFTDQQLALARSALSEEDDWSLWLQQVELNGLSGVVNEHVHNFGLALPDQVRLSLRALTIRHKAAAEARLTTLRLIADSFAQNELDFIALKGVALVPRLYRNAGLRPMRDMDLLVPISQQALAADCLRDIGFDLPQAQPSKYMRYSHQLPNATLQVNGFTSSVELHHDALTRDVAGGLPYPEQPSNRQTLEWEGVPFQAFDDLTMLHQVSRHLVGLHPGGIMKLINVMDVIGLASEIEQQGGWPALTESYPHVLTTLKCLHLLTPLPDNLVKKLTPLADAPMSGVGQIMQSLTEILLAKRPWAQRLKMLFAPSDWWLHLHYNVDPEKSIWLIKLVRHPWRVMVSLVQRVLSLLLGG